MKDLEAIRQYVNDYAAARDWQSFHSPKNIAMALTVEAAELQEHFQWLTEQESTALTAEKCHAVAEEIADVQVYLVMLADKLGIDILNAVADKMKKNETKYPADKVRGSAKKWHEYDKQ